MTVKQLINKKTLRTMIPLSDRTIDEMEKKGKFPKRFALTSRYVVWDKADVEAWMDAQKAAALKADRPGEVKPSA